VKLEFSLIVVLMLSALLFSCGEDTVNTCDLWTASAIVSGQVTDSDSGNPITNAEVEVMVANSSKCDGAEQWIYSSLVMTDKNGQFSIKLELGNQKGIRCIGVRETMSGVLASDTVEFVGGCSETRSPGQLALNISI
jgi:hypothetical protein